VFAVFKTVCKKSRSELTLYHDHYMTNLRFRPLRY